MIFYRDEEALDSYLKHFPFLNDRSGCVERRVSIHNGREYRGSFFSVVCHKGLSENARGYKAHFVAVQEDLTWKESWPELRDCVLQPMLMSPIPICVFDSVSYDEAAAHEEVRWQRNGEIQDWLNRRR